MTVPTVHDGPAARAEAGRSVVGRALAVLDAFSNERPEQTLGAICEATGLPSATTHRLVNELVAWGALERVGRGRTRGWRYPRTAVAQHVRVGYRRPT